MTEKQEKYFKDLEETFMTIVDKEIKDVKERLEREGFKTTYFEGNATTLRAMAKQTIQKLGVKFLDRSTRDTCRIKIDNNIKILYLLGTRDEEVKSK